MHSSGLRASELIQMPARTRRVAERDRAFEESHLRTMSVTVLSAKEAEGAWRDAIEHCECFVFQTVEWISAWRATIGANRKLTEHIVRVAGADGRTVLVLPLGVFDCTSVRVLSFLGGYTCDYNAPIIDRRFAEQATPEEFAHLWRAILNALPPVDVVWLDRMPEAVETAPNRLIELHGAVRAGSTSGASLPLGFAEFAKARSAQFFSQNRRKWKKLAAVGKVEARYSTDPQERIETVRRWAEQKSLWFQQAGLRNMLNDPAVLAFYERVTNCPLQVGEIVVAHLRVDDKIVATIWGAVFRARFYLILTSYKLEWTPRSVGRLLMERVIQWCIERGDLRVFDLTIGEETYKRHWADHSMATYELLEPCSVKGVLFVAQERLRRRLRRVFGLGTIARTLRAAVTKARRR